MTEAHLIEPVLVLEPILIAAQVPAGEAVVADFDSLFGKFFTDFGERHAIEDEVIYFIAEEFAQARDGTTSAAAEGGGIFGVVV